MSHAPNPYASPAASMHGPGGTPIPKFASLQYLYAFKFVVESPNWLMNLLIGALAIFSASIIPIIGPLIFMGYEYEIIDHLHRRRTMPYPDFDFNRFSQYLSRGVPPFVASLIFGVLAGMLAAIMYLVSFLGIMATAAALASAEVSGAIVAFICILLGTLAFVLFLALLALMMAITTPMTLRAGLSGNIGEGFNFEFIKDFIARMWKEMLLAYLWLMVAGQLLVLVGMLACCIGVYPAAAWNMLASGHFQWQLYELYLDRGGMKIPLKPEG